LKELKLIDSTVIAIDSSKIYAEGKVQEGTDEVYDHMKKEHKRGYKIFAIYDPVCGILIDFILCPINKGDNPNLIPLIERAREILGESTIKKVFFDRGFYDGEHFDWLNTNNIKFVCRGKQGTKVAEQVNEILDEQYIEELTRIEQTFAPFIEKCKSLKRAIRIGTNHGSLSDRVMNRFGDTPEGMVESAMEYVRLAEAQQFDQIILSMKSSNPVVMLNANRLLVQALDNHGSRYPLHLGVTEAGEGEDARIKSAMGIGVLLAEGIGDTIRVSLTEDPVQEVPVAKALADWAQARWDAGLSLPPPVRPFDWVRHETAAALYGTTAIGGSEPVKVGFVEGDYDHPRAAGTKDMPCELVLKASPDLKEKFHVIEARELLAAGREAVRALPESDRKPILLVWDARDFVKDDVTFLIEAAVQVGGLLVDGIGDAVLIRSRFPAGRILNLTYNVLQAAEWLGINKVCIASSINAVGMDFSRAPTYDYLPMDEKHPGRPEDCYSLSKWCCEQAADAFALKNPDMMIASMRYPATVPSHVVEERRKQDQNRYAGWSKALWGYLDARDAARANSMVMEAEWKGHEVFFITAKENFAGIPSARARLGTGGRPRYGGVGCVERVFDTAALVPSRSWLRTAPLGCLDCSPHRDARALVAFR